MGRDYRKYTVAMELVSDDYRFWQTGVDASTCIAETYKEKRSIYLAVSNLLPSVSLLSESNREYRLMLMGADVGEIIHKDFGPYFVNIKGDGNVFRKFDGPPLEVYTHCILAAVNKESGKAETVMKGTMPFFTTEERSRPGGFDHIWGKIVESAAEGNAVEAFSADWDETGAVWHRIESLEPLPAPISGCRQQAAKYSHYIFGERGGTYYIGIPGRFLKAEQPMQEEKCFVLWQPVRGGERYFKDLADMPEKLQKDIYGYWIAGIDSSSGGLLPL